MTRQEKTNKSGKSPWLYGPLWLFFIYLFVLILAFRHGEPTHPIVGGMYFVQFGVHEASHLVTMFLPSILVAAAGSFGEILFPVLIVIAALRGKAFFAAIFGMLWLSLALRSVGQYIADARTQAIPLVGPGENIKHDWNYILGELGWLNADMAIGGVVQAAGVIVGILALMYGLRLIVKYFLEQPG